MEFSEHIPEEPGFPWKVRAFCGRGERRLLLGLDKRWRRFRFGLGRGLLFHCPMQFG